MNLISSKKRVDWIDLCKFIAIFCVVWSHVGMPALGDKYIHVFHMPIFFFLSGFLLDLDRYKTFKSFFYKKIKTLLVPYFLFPVAIFYIMFVIYYIKNIPFPESQLTLWKSIFTYNAGNQPNYGTLQWFLTCLFLVEILFFGIAKLFKKNKIVISFMLIILSLIGYFIYDYLQIRLLWGLDITFTAIVFYGLGYLINNITNENIKTFILNPRPYKILVLSTISVITSFTNEYVNMRLLLYGNYFLFYISSLSSILMLILLAKYICNISEITKSRAYKWIQYIGQNTIVVLVLNDIIILFLKHFTGYTMLAKNHIRNFVFTIVVIVIMIPTSLLLNKYLSWAIGKKKTN